jgi:radical SAM superfamily enzyme YgiQ (UPF0313 family)
MSTCTCQPGGFFVNLHGPYDLAYVQVGEREYTFDKGGRLLWLIEGLKKIERSLNGRLVEKADPGDDFVYKRSRELDAADAEQLRRSVAAQINEILSELRAGHSCAPDCRVYRHKNETEAFLNRAVTQLSDREQNEARQFNSIYQPVAIVPNDLRHPLIVQVTEGCAYNGCSFCGLYRGRQYREKSYRELQGHLLEIKAFVGDSLQNMRSVFLGDANALMVEQSRLRAIFDLINQELPIRDQPSALPTTRGLKGPAQQPAFDGIYAFIDAWYGRDKTVEDFRELRDRKLARVYVGLESGSDHLLRFVRKRNRLRQVLELVQTIKQAGISIGVMVMAGLGGDRFYDEHVDSTARAINQLGLSGSDAIYFSHLVIHPHAPYGEDTKREGIQHLSYEQERAQIHETVSKLRFGRAGAPTIRGYEVNHVRF